MLDKKTIVHITYKISSGGLEQVLLQTVNGTPQYKHIVLSITTVDSFRERFNPDTRFISLNKAPGNSFSVLKRGLKVLKNIKPDIVHTYNLAGAEFLPIAWLAGVKRLIHCEHGTPQTQQANRSAKLTLMRRVFLFFAQKVIVVSTQLKAWLVSDVNIAKHKVVIVPNGVNTSAYTFIPFTSKASFTIGTVARLSKEKNQQLLLHAFAKFIEKLSLKQQQNCFLRIVGDGPERASLESICQSLRISDKVTFVGNSDTVATELSQLDVFVLSSISEGMPMTILEAMSLGLPILSTDVGNIKGVLASSGGGVVVPSNDIDALSQQMLSLFNSEDTRQNMGLKGSGYVREHCSIERMLDAYSNVYEA